MQPHSASASALDSDLNPETLRDCIERTRSRVEGGELALGPVVQDLGRLALTLVCLIKCLPFLQPIPLGPLATLAGSAFALIGWQLFLGRVPKLPSKIHQFQFQYSTWQSLFGAMERVDRWAGFLSKPRFQNLASSPRLRGALVCSAGVLMALPLPFIPASNTLPALVILTAALADLRRDGLMVVLSSGFLALTVLYFSAVMVGIAWMGEGFWTWIQSFFG